MDLRENIEALEENAEILEKILNTMPPVEDPNPDLLRPARDYPALRNGMPALNKGRNRKKIEHIVFSDEVKEKVIELASEGKDANEIAVLLGCTKPMLRNRCRKELYQGFLAAREMGIRTRRRSTDPTVSLSDAERYQIQVMSGLGLKVDQMATILNLSMSNLVENYQDDIQKGRALAIERVSKVLFDMAVDYEHPNETKFYLKAQAGWKESTQVEFPDADGKPQSISGDTVNLNLTAENMQNVISMLNEKV